jgi:branched-chain amino acid transport system ATP-binding protein
VSLLEVRSIDARHGLLAAVRAVSLHLEPGERLAIVGANGAGKTTLLRTIAGAHASASGRIVFDGIDISAIPAHRRAALGIALVPEGRRLFASMTVEENLLVARACGRQGPWNIDTVLEAFPQLKPRRKARAGTLSGGEQQATAIGRALMTNPRVLLLDEVSLGLSPLAVDRVYASLQALIRAGTSIVLVEQDLKRAMESSDRIVCMLEGRIVAEGRSGEITRETILQTYFGARTIDALAGGNGAGT